MTTTRQTRQTVRINGKRTVLTTRNGKVTAKAADPLEWELQAAQVRRLRGMPEYGTQFLLAGDQNSAKRGPTAQAQAVAAGMTAGEADLRIYLRGGQVRHIENKVGNGRLQPVQVKRHGELEKLGHTVVVLRAVSEQEAADKAEACVREWLTEPVAADNDNAAAFADDHKLQ
ncbi:MAG: oxidoreductase [Ahrensia sp.]|nr:oxidoreductase [Ahrensia sp.]MBV48160.1 oxidoreductase [Roseobacter sp.]MBV48261.1 oxidoreductase [Roseobacter sp.]|tara:strand:- start:133374 stop:133889 length:516 start_codon:yes stop_codon:yes gene_type:complete